MRIWEPLCMGVLQHDLGGGGWKVSCRHGSGQESNQHVDPHTWLKSYGICVACSNASVQTYMGMKCAEPLLQNLGPHEKSVSNYSQAPNRTQPHQDLQHEDFSTRTQRLQSLI